MAVEIVDGRKLALDRHAELDPATGCILWTGTRNKDGYGVVSYLGRQRFAHRLSYEYHVGPIPDGLELDHTCERRNCINPEHLEPVTTLENRVRHYLRRGAPRDAAENTAKRELADWAKNRAIRRYGPEQGALVGIVPGVRVHVGRKLEPYTVIRCWTYGLDEPVRVDLKSEKDGETRTVELGGVHLFEERRWNLNTMMVWDNLPDHD